MFLTEILGHSQMTCAKVFALAKSGQNPNVHQQENLKVFHIRQYYVTVKEKTNKNHTYKHHLG